MSSYIYKIVCKNTDYDYWCYIGSTNDIKGRIRTHRYNCNNSNSKKYDYNVYECIRELGGFDNWNFEIIEVLENNINIKIIEQKYIEEYGTLNTQRANRTKEQYNQDVYDSAERCGIINKYKCECGKILQKRCKNRHEKTKKHIDYLNSVISLNSESI